jgi:glycosyltransferase involved in cell wall biosynthesis
MHPRTLILSPNTFTFQNGTGVTFSALFAQWPNARLANLHSSPQEPDLSVCQNFYRFSAEDIQRPWPFRKKAEASSLGSAPPNSGEGSLQAFWRTHIVGNSGLPQRFVPSAALDRWLEAFQPELIYTVLGPLPHLEACLYIKRKYKAKLAIHFMDDWYAQAYTTGIFRYQRRKMLRLFHTLVEEADLHLTIGDRMSKVLSARYGKKMAGFQNAINVEKFRGEIARFRGPPRPPAQSRLLYFGSVLPFAQADTLALVANAVNRLNAQGRQLRLRIVTGQDCIPDCQARLKDFPCVEILPIDGRQEQFTEELGAADTLLLPANFNSYSEEYLRYSMPTKLPGYMASGAPVLVCGPESIAQVLYAQERGWGLCVSTQDPEELLKAVQKITEDEALRASLLARAVETVQSQHNIEDVRARFQSRLMGLVPND